MMVRGGQEPPPLSRRPLRRCILDALPPTRCMKKQGTTTVKSEAK